MVLLEASELSEDLLRNRKEIVDFYGFRWLTIREPWQKVLQAFMENDGTGILVTAQKIAKMALDEDKPLEARFALALAVEEIEKEGRAE